MFNTGVLVKREAGRPESAVGNEMAKARCWRDVSPGASSQAGHRVKGPLLRINQL